MLFSEFVSFILELAFWTFLEFNLLLKLSRDLKHELVSVEVLGEDSFELLVRSIVIG